MNDEEPIGIFIIFKFNDFSEIRYPQGIIRWLMSQINLILALSSSTDKLKKPSWSKNTRSFGALHLEIALKSIEIVSPKSWKLQVRTHTPWNQFYWVSNNRISTVHHTHSSPIAGLTADKTLILGISVMMKWLIIPFFVRSKDRLSKL